jgi:hypothetical protein
MFVCEGLQPDTFGGLWGVVIGHVADFTGNRHPGHAVVAGDDNGGMPAVLSLSNASNTVV